MFGKHCYQRTKNGRNRVRTATRGGWSKMFSVSTGGLSLCVSRKGRGQ